MDGIDNDDTSRFLIPSAYPKEANNPNPIAAIENPYPTLNEYPVRYQVNGTTTSEDMAYKAPTPLSDVPIWLKKNDVDVSILTSSDAIDTVYQIKRINQHTWYQSIF